ncbi:MAG: hypothetical protein KBA31_03715 [Alphaproteobacteria bacterium]|nr:hypothetical protein [Alphaproteobacteria bacterium]
MSRIALLAIVVVVALLFFLFNAVNSEPNVNYGFFNYYCDPAADRWERAFDFIKVIFGNLVALSITVLILVGIVMSIAGGGGAGEVDSIFELIGSILAVLATIAAAIAAMAGISSATCDARTALVEPTFVLGSSSLSKQGLQKVEIDRDAIASVGVEQAIDYLRAVQHNRPHLTYIDYTITVDELRKRPFREIWCDFSADGQTVQMAWQHGQIGDYAYATGIERVQTKDAVVEIWGETNVGPSIYLWWHPGADNDDGTGGFDKRRIKRCVVAPYRFKARYDKMVLGTMIALGKIGANRTFFTGNYRSGYCRTTIWKRDWDLTECSLEGSDFRR